MVSLLTEPALVIAVTVLARAWLLTFGLAVAGMGQVRSQQEPIQVVNLLAANGSSRVPVTGQMNSYAVRGKRAFALTTF